MTLPGKMQEPSRDPMFTVLPFGSFMQELSSADGFTGEGGSDAVGEVPFVGKGLRIGDGEDSGFDLVEGGGVVCVGSGKRSDEPTITSAIIANITTPNKPITNCPIFSSLPFYFFIARDFIQ